EHNAHRMPAWIALRISKRANLFQTNAAQPGLFAKLALGSVLERLFLVHKATGESPTPLERIARAFDQQHIHTLCRSVKQHYVHCYRRARIIVTVSLHGRLFGL